MDAAPSPDPIVGVPDKTRLRILACGSVDDGKSTLIGRLLHDIGEVCDDHLDALARDSRRYGTAGDDLDFALLLDGLEAEREQGITIDVAYRYFATPRRAFMVADAPGHEQYTRNMATGASNADIAVILVDARKGILPQTRRHSCIAALLGIRRVVLAVNKMDLVGFAEAPFRRIAADYAAFAAPLDLAGVTAIPISARRGDNVARPGADMPWYAGPTLVAHLEAVDAEADAPGRPFRMPVQWVNRPHQDFRGFAGTVASGRVAPGDAVVVARSGRVARVARIVTMDGDRHRADAGDAVTLVLDAEVDASRGDVIAAADARPEVADQLAADIVWLGDEPMFPGRQYLLKTAAKTVAASVTALKHKIDVADLGAQPARALAQNDIGLCNLSLAEPVAFDPYRENRTTGSFILIDRYTDATVGAGMIRFALRRASNIPVQHVDVDKRARAALKRQQPTALWFTGLSGAGKSTVANLVEQRLHALGHHTYLLDGDNVRHGLNRDLGFLAADRVENMRRVGEVARLMLDAGLIVMASLISPFRAERRMVRELMAPGEFVEIHVDAPIELCRRRDPKGLYRKADAGLIKNFTGVDSPYEPPLEPELRLHSDREPPAASAERVIDYLRHLGRI
jgi:bifunctional enzyme CysN/CysC